MTAKLSPEMQARVVNLLLADFDKRLLARLTEELGDKAPHVPQVTLRNISSYIVKANATSISASYGLKFQDSGRIVDMRRIRPGDVRNLDAIRAWVKKQGLSAFKTVPGYSETPSGIDEMKALERISQAVARNLADGYTKTKRKAAKSTWINRNFYGFFGQLVGDFQTKQSEFLIEAYTNTIKDTYQVIKM